MILAVGLGNPGIKYKDNRHNIGFQILDNVAEHSGIVFNEKGIVSGFVAQINPDLLLLKPETFMNHSGISVRAALRNYDATLVVVYDDIDIALGEVKVSFGKGAGGHNGVQSIIDHLGTKDFIRVRVGVRPVHEMLASKILPPYGFETFLLSNFAPFEEEKRKEGMDKAIVILMALTQRTLAEVMNQYN